MNTNLSDDILRFSNVIGQVVDRHRCDVFIGDAAVAWPGLRELRFAWGRFDSRAVTFAAVVSLASKCRSLRTLQLMFNATQFPILPRAPDGTHELWPMRTALHELHIAHSSVLGQSQLFLFLAVVFPNLAHLTRYDVLRSGDDHKWGKVKEVWEHMVKHRAVEAFWQNFLLQARSWLEEDAGDDE